MLLEQGLALRWNHRRWMGQGEGRVSVQHPPWGWTLQGAMGYWRYAPFLLPPHPLALVLIRRCAGSGSTYIYGYCDSTYRENWGRDETVEFVKNGTSSVLLPSFAFIVEEGRYLMRVALALAMSRDGSSGGTIRMAIIQESGVERVFIPGDKLPSQYLPPPFPDWIVS